MSEIIELVPELTTLAAPNQVTELDEWFGSLATSEQDGFRRCLTSNVFASDRAAVQGLAMLMLDPATRVAAVNTTRALWWPRKHYPGFAQTLHSANHRAILQSLAAGSPDEISAFMEGAGQPAITSNPQVLDRFLELAVDPATRQALLMPWAPNPRTIEDKMPEDWAQGLAWILLRTDYRAIVTGLHDEITDPEDRLDLCCAVGNEAFHDTPIAEERLAEMLSASNTRGILAATTTATFDAHYPAFARILQRADYQSRLEEMSSSDNRNGKHRPILTVSGSPAFGQSPKALERLFQLLDDPESRDTVLTVARDLSYAGGPQVDQECSGLARVLRTDNYRVILKAIADSGSIAPGAVPRLLASFDSPTATDDYNRLPPAPGASTEAEDLAQARLEAGLGALSESDELVCVRAVRALGEMTQVRAHHTLVGIGRQPSSEERLQVALAFAISCEVPGLLQGTERTQVADESSDEEGAGPPSSRKPRQSGPESVKLRRPAKLQTLAMRMALEGIAEAGSALRTTLATGDPSADIAALTRTVLQRALPFSQDGELMHNILENVSASTPRAVEDKPLPLALTRTTPAHLRFTSTIPTDPSLKLS